MVDQPGPVLVDEQAVRDVLMRYFVGLDRREGRLFEDVFTPGARMSVLGGARVLDGRAQIVEALLGVSDYPMSSHHSTSQRITVQARSATADTFAVAYLVTNDGRIVVRGIQYLDELERTAEGWRIVNRQHIPQWQYGADATPTRLPGRQAD